MSTHLPGNWSKGGPRFALCGRRLNENHQLSRNGEYTCPECQQLDDQEAASLLALQQEPYTGPPLNTSASPIVPEGYRPKGSR
jgi:hypothetical protein